MKGSKRKIWAFRLFWLWLVMAGCQTDSPVQPEGQRDAADVILTWNTLLLDLERYTPGYRAPVAARMVAYVGAAAWQAALPGLNDAYSIHQYCPGLEPPDDAPASFFLPASLNAAYAEILRQFFYTAPPHLQEKIQQTEIGFAQQLRSRTDQETYRQSAAFGKQAAYDVWRWSALDTVGHDGFLANFDKNYHPKVCAGCWEPVGEFPVQALLPRTSNTKSLVSPQDEDHPLPALLPYWGNSRHFIVDPHTVRVRPPVVYDERSGSAFHSEGMAVYALSAPLSTENRWIAEFWSDDVPGLTITPAGRWVSITNQALQKAKLDSREMLEVYLKLGLALSDAIVICWDAKYRYNLLRPETYIRKVINPAWHALHDTPPFPTYPSGHSAMGAACAEVLSVFLGAEFELTDRTHENRQEFDGRPRRFHSFDEMAQESAVSRLALGVHFRMDCEEGLRIGKIIGQKVATLPLNPSEVGVRN